MLQNYYTQVVDYLHNHEIKIIKDIIIPILSPEKIVAIIGIYYVVKTFQANYKLSRVNFIHQLTISHRDIWLKVAEKRIDFAKPIEGLDNISSEEYRFAIFIILHIKMSYEAHRAKVSVQREGEFADIGTLLNKPLPNAVWEQIKDLHESDFVFYIDSCKHLADPEKYPRPKKIFLDNFFK